MSKEFQTKPRAKLVELTFDKEQGSYKKEGGRSIEVQFNPQTLTVKYTNQKSGGDQQGSSGVQFVGKGSTKLTVDLLFDVTRPTGDESLPDDVRTLTRRVNWFMRALEERENESENGGQYVPPLVRFVWGSFLFEGVMVSMDEMLEFFDPEGRPLRATVATTISRQEIHFEQRETDPLSGVNVGANVGAGEGSAGANSSAGGGPEDRPAGAENTHGTSVQQLAAEQGEQENWKSIAEKNGIENPRAIHNPGAVTI